MTLSFYLTIMVHPPQISTYSGAEKRRGRPALAIREQPMATALVSVETREVVRCEHCTLVQYRTSNSLCRKCHRPLDIEEPFVLGPQPVPAAGSFVGGSRVARGCPGAGHPQSAPPEPASTGQPHAGPSHVHLQNRERQGNSHARFARAPGGRTGSGCVASWYGMRAAVARRRWRRSWPIRSWPRLPLCCRVWTRCRGRCSTEPCGTRPRVSAAPRDRPRRARSAARWLGNLSPLRCVSRARLPTGWRGSIEAQAGPARQRDTADDTPAGFLDFAVLNALGVTANPGFRAGCRTSGRRWRRPDRLPVSVVGDDFLRRVNSQLRRRQRKDQPALPRIHMRQIQHVAKKGPIGFRIAAGKQQVNAVNHATEF